MKNILPHELDHWHRKGRGHEVQFYGTNADFEKWLKHDLSAVERKLNFILVPWKEEDVASWKNTRSVGIDRLIQVWDADSNLPGIASTWIWPTQIMPDLDWVGVDDLKKYFSFNGLISIDCESLSKKKVRASRVSMVSRIARDDTGEVVFHSEAFKLFSCLRNMIKQDLCYATIGSDINGREFEDSKDLLMTEAFANYWEKVSVKSNRRPGNRLG